MNAPFRRPVFVPATTPYGLMLRARLKAFLHVWAGFKPIYQIVKSQPVCQIWRMYSHFGFRTYRVFCTCGKEFR